MAITIRPTSLETSDKQLAKAWLALQKRLQALVLSLVTGAGQSTTIYVDAVNGDDATGVRGSILNPFATVQAGLAAAIAGDTILISPGTYAENVVIPATDRLTIEGAGVNTIINGGATFAIGCLSNLTRATIRDIRVINNSAGDPAVVFSYDGQAFDTAFSDLLQFINVEVVNSGGGESFHLESLNNFSMENCRTTGLIGVELVHNGTITGHVGDTLFTEYDPINEAPIPAQGLGVIVIEQSVFSGLVQLGDIPGTDVNIGVLRIESDCVVGSLLGMVTDEAAFPDSGRLIFRGTCLDGAGGDFNANFDDAGASHWGYDFDHSRFEGTISCLELGGGQVLTVTARNAVLLNTITADNGSALDIRNSTFLQANLASAGGVPGTIDRTLHREDVAAGGGAVVFACPFGSANYNVPTELANRLDGPVDIQAKANTGFTVTPTAANGALHCTVIMQDP